MADFLTQKEIDALLAVCDDVEEFDYGSERFKEAYLEYDKWLHDDRSGFCPDIPGSDPTEIIGGLREIENTYKKYIRDTKENLKKFQVFHEKLLEIAEDEPEIFI